MINFIINLEKGSEIKKLLFEIWPIQSFNEQNKLQYLEIFQDSFGTEDCLQKIECTKLKKSLIILMEEPL